MLIKSDTTIKIMGVIIVITRQIENNSGVIIGKMTIDNHQNKIVTISGDKIHLDIDSINEAFSEMEIILDKLTRWKP